MKLPNYVKPMPRFLNKVFPKGITVALNKNIYLNSKIFADLKIENPNPINVSILLHEEEHRKSFGLVYGLKYQLFPKQRLNEELKAYRAQFSYLKKHNEIYDLERVARKLSGPMYMFATNYKNAKRLLEKTWEEA